MQLLLWQILPMWKWKLKDTKKPGRKVPVKIFKLNKLITDQQLSALRYLHY